MNNYWLTLSVAACDHAKANELAEKAAAHAGGRVVEVQPEPPQGSTIVGDFWDHEDGVK